MQIDEWLQQHITLLLAIFFTCAAIANYRRRNYWIAIAEAIISVSSLIIAIL